MTQKPLSALLVLNVVLLAILGVLTLSPTPASAQLGARGNYLMISGSAVGRTNQAAIYIVELNTARMITVFFNSANNTFEPIAATNISEDAARAVSGR